jgi:hypothetical protein
VRDSPLLTPPRETGLLFVLHFHVSNMELLMFEGRIYQKIKATLRQA